MPAYLLEADIELGEGCDPAAVGAAVTVELCGHWEHEGPCTWPHYSEIDAEREPAHFFTRYEVSEDEEPEIRARIERSLCAAADWRVVSVRARGRVGERRRHA